MIAVVVVHPEALSRPDNPLSGLGGNGELLDVKAQDVQATKCAEMPCILAKQGDENNNNNNNNGRVNNDLSFSWSIISQPVNTGNVNLVSLAFPTWCICVSFTYTQLWFRKEMFSYVGTKVGTRTCSDLNL